MIVGVMTVELALLDAQTLKDKRQIVQSLKQRLSNRFSVSICETDYGDYAKRCQLGIALVSTESRMAHSLLDKVVEVVRRTAGLTLISYERQLL